jgi:HEAT repeat protein
MPKVPPEVRYTMLEHDRRRKVRQFLPYKEAGNATKLIEILLQRKEITDRAVAALLLAVTGGAETISTLEKVLKTPGNYPNKWASEYVQQWVAIALGYRGKNAGISFLEQLLKHPYPLAVREARRHMCRALKRINTPRAIDLLKIAAKDKDPRVSQLAQQLLENK